VVLALRDRGKTIMTSRLEWATYETLPQKQKQNKTIRRKRM
jgi:hypothetical protein